MLADIPTELLRTLITVVDFRNYTRAAEFLRITQPAVSGHLKRLQEILGGELFDKSAPGVRLTVQGELAANYARRILSMNDQLMNMMKPVATIKALKLGLPNVFVDKMLPQVLRDLHERAPEMRVHVASDLSENLLRDLHLGKLDLVIAGTLTEPASGVRSYWFEEMVWLGTEETKIDPTKPVPIITHVENNICLYGRLAKSVLSQAGRDYEVTFTGTNTATMTSAVLAGLGVIVRIRRGAPSVLKILDSAPLPKLPDIIFGIYQRLHDNDEELSRMAIQIGELLKP